MLAHTGDRAGASPPEEDTGLLNPAHAAGLGGRCLRAASDAASGIFCRTLHSVSGAGVAEPNNRDLLAMGAIHGKSRAW